MKSSKRAILLVIGLLLGAFFGRLLGHQLGETFSLPQQPDPNRWRIISAGLAEGIGQKGVGRISHIAGGALNLATHVFIRPDMAVPQFDGNAHSISIELAEDSGSIWAQVGEAPGRFVRLRPGAVSTGALGQAWQDVGATRQFHLQIEQGQLWVEAGDHRASAGSARPGPVEFSSVDEWARLSRLSIQDQNGETLFQDDFRGARIQRSTLNLATLLGGAIGVAIAVLCFDFGVSRLLFCLGLLFPIGLCLWTGRADWLRSVERLYLDKTAPSSFASWALALSLMPLFSAATIEIVRGTVWRIRTAKYGLWVWLGMLAFALLQAGPISIVSAMAVGFFAGSGLVLGLKKAPMSWWWIDAVGWLLFWMFGSTIGPFVLAIWRLISVSGLVSLWLRSDPLRAVGLLMVALAMVPLGAEHWVRESPVGQAWQMGRLSGERPNEKGWENPESTWTGRCGAEDSAQTVSVVVAGGSSVGGAYQFGGQPEAFFTAVAHHQLCDELPQGTQLITYNFGDGDRNTFTISRTIDSHLLNADILVLYVGVNDVFTTQNTLTRKQREEEQKARSESMKGLMSWVSRSRLMVAGSLWVRSNEATYTEEQVADVPLADALENHRHIIDAARSQGVQVLLMTEYVQESQRHRLYEYANMQTALQSEDVAWYDVRHAFSGAPDSETLADRNHLSILGNRRLGEALAEQLRPWVYGDSR